MLALFAFLHLVYGFFGSVNRSVKCSMIRLFDILLHVELIYRSIDLLVPEYQSNRHFYYLSNFSARYFNLFFSFLMLLFLRLYENACYGTKWRPLSRALH